MVETMDAAPVRKRLPESLRSCHTATLDGYIVEGHVPADVIRQLLRDRPRVEGIAVPGMPAGSPGMESNTRSRRVWRSTRRAIDVVFAKRRDQLSRTRTADRGTRTLISSLRMQ